MILLVVAVASVSVFEELLEIHNKAWRDIKKIREAKHA